MVFADQTLNQTVGFLIQHPMQFKKTDLFKASFVLPFVVFEAVVNHLLVVFVVSDQILKDELELVDRFELQLQTLVLVSDEFEVGIDKNGQIKV